MYINKKRKKPPTETIFETQARLRKEALELAKKHQDVKPIKYLLK